MTGYYMFWMVSHIELHPMQEAKTELYVGMDIWIIHTIYTELDFIVWARSQMQTHVY